MWESYILAAHFANAGAVEKQSNSCLVRRDQGAWGRGYG